MKAGGDIVVKKKHSEEGNWGEERVMQEDECNHNTLYIA